VVRDGFGDVLWQVVPPPPTPVLGVLLEEVRSWGCSLKGTQHLRALVVFDEVYGFLPPHPEGLAGSGGEGAGSSRKELEATLKKLAPRWFMLRDAHAKDGMRLLNPRWAMSYLRGPMTGVEIRAALAGGGSGVRVEAEELSGVERGLGAAQDGR
jgi:hypothetical protein